MHIIQAIWIRVLEIYARKLRDQASALPSPQWFRSHLFFLPWLWAIVLFANVRIWWILQQNTHLPSLTTLPSQAMSFVVSREEWTDLQLNCHNQPKCVWDDQPFLNLPIFDIYGFVLGKCLEWLCCFWNWVEDPWLLEMMTSCARIILASQSKPAWKTLSPAASIEPAGIKCPDLVQFCQCCPTRDVYYASSPFLWKASIRLPPISCLKVSLLFDDFFVGQHCWTNHTHDRSLSGRG